MRSSSSSRIAKIARDAAQRARIEARDDLATLERWLIRAAEVRDAAELPA